MKTYTIQLTTISDVQNLVSTVSLMDSEFDLISGRYIVDAKSIMGIFSLDLQNPLELKVYSPTEEIEAKIRPFIVEG